MSGARFVKVPAELLYELPGQQLRAYLVLAHNAIAVSRDTFEMTGDQLGTLLGLTRRQAIRVLDELIARGLVEIEGNRGRGRPNLITVLDPQGTVFAGLHVDRAGTSMSQEAETEMSQPAVPKMSQPSNKEERSQRDRGLRGAHGALTLPSPVDNRGAARTRDPRCNRPGHEYATVNTAGVCTACRSEKLGPPPF